MAERETGIVRLWSAASGSTLVHWSRDGFSSICRRTIRSAYSAHQDRVTCKECLTRLADGYLHRDGRGTETTIMDDIHEEALELVRTRKNNARKRWELALLVDACHDMALREPRK